MPQGYRLAKIMAMLGIGSRRQCELWIQQGAVEIEGKVCTEWPAFIHEGQKLSMGGKSYHVTSKPPQPRLWRFHKPEGVLITRAPDPEGRPILGDILPSEHGNLISIGRLDYTSRGLLLLTNSGRLARFMELPTSSIPRRYAVDIKNAKGFETLEADILQIQAGMVVEGLRYGPIPVISKEIKDSVVRLNLVLYEGKNREIRRIMQALGYHVVRLERVAYGQWSLGNLASGTLSEVSEAEVKAFYTSRILKFDVA